MHRLLGMLLLALLLAPAARADSDLVVGIVDDQLKWTAHPRPTTSILRDLGIGALRVPLEWRRGESRLSRADATTLNRVVVGTFPMRIVLTVNGRAREAPRTDAERARFCAFVRDALARYPSINDVTIWNEVNSNAFWQPQYQGGVSVAPRDYAALLARCYDALHQLRPKVNVMTDTAPRGNDNAFALSNPGHSPGEFVRRLGEAYRASGRNRPLFDNVGHHPYGDFSLESPFFRHPNTGSIGQGDYDKLVAAYELAFAGTDQPTIGRGARIWYLESGFETTVPASKRSHYTGTERSRTVGADSLHREQLLDAVRLAYCQPHVASYFNFLLSDERNLAGWQSGLLWADGTKKPAYAGFKAVVREVRLRAVSCTALRSKEAAILAGGFVHLPPRKP